MTKFKPFPELYIADDGEDDTYTEGVCADGAAILKDGVMMRITDVLEELNDYALINNWVEDLIKRVRAIAEDFVPDHERYAMQALQEMRDALIELVENVEVK